MNSHPTACPATLPATEAARAAPTLPALTALGVQAVAAAIVLACVFAWRSGALPALPLAAWALLQGMLALVMAWRLRMQHWWLPIHFGFVPLATFAHGWQLPPPLFMTAFLLLLLVHGATFRTRVPTHLSRRDAIAAAASLMPATARFRCLDLGCGTGSALAAWTQARPNGRHAGVEGAVLPFLASWWRGQRHGFDVRFGDLWDADLSSCDVVYAFLSPACMDRLWAKARAEMRPGTLLISNEFPVPGMAPEICIPLRGRRRASLYAWRIPAS